MTTTGCVDCIVPPSGFALCRSRRRWCLGLGASLLLHGALLWLPVGGARQGGAGSAPIPALMLTLRSPSPRAAAPSSLPSLASLAPRGDSRRSLSLPRIAVVASPAPTESRPVEAAPQPRLDLDELRAQARDLARAPPGQPLRGGERGDRPLPPAAVFDPLDAKRLDALARRIGKPLPEASERRLADGSRMVRFAGNVCLHVPRHLPPGFENAFGPTVLLPTNCRD